MSKPFGENFGTPSVNVPQPVLDATKAVNAAYVLGGAWLALLVTSFVDGSVTWDEGGKLIGAGVAAAGAIMTVFKSTNKPKK